MSFNKVVSQSVSVLLQSPWIYISLGAIHQRVGSVVAICQSHFWLLNWQMAGSKAFNNCVVRLLSMEGI